MHTFSETGAGVPAFLAKLWRLVDDPDTNNLICWSKDGRSFIIQNQAQFARELLPLNYKHNNMASFIRQLNMYGFHKITSIDNGGLKFDRDEMEFSHPCFKRNCSYLLEHIKRKIANTKGLDEKSALKPEAVTKVLQDVKAMRGRQDSLDSRFSVMKQENEALWREIASLRQKHAKQQQIVNKLIQFLITIVQPTRNMTSVKRQMQLMINDKPENGKFRKTSESDSECGPVIHELGEELLDEVTDADVELIDPNSPYNQMAAAQARDNETPSPLNIERPTSSISQVSQHYDYSNQSIEDVLNSAAGVVTPSTAAVFGGKSNADGGVGGRAAFANAAAAMSPSSSSIIQSVNPDGSRIVYHVTEVPDGNDVQARDNAATMPPNYNEDNVLTTPLVRQQMERSQQLKQKNKQRRRQADIETAVKFERSNQQQQRLATTSTSQQQQQQEHRQQQQQKQIAVENIQIKAEKEIDPMSFLNVFPDDNALNTDSQLMSPNLSEDSRQSGINITAAAGGVGLMGTNTNNNNNNNRSATTTPTTDALMSATSTDFYNPDNFITGDMPADIFDDSSLLSADNNNYNNDFKLNQQQQFGRSTATGGKFSTYIAGNNNNNNNINNNNNNSNANVASTSAAAAAAAGANGAISKRSAASTSTSQGKNGNNMAVTKYNDETMRLSTPDEVIGHLDNVQDELESLKDLLRGDGYSLDANALIGNGASTQNSNNRFYLTPTGVDGDFLNKLFNDSEILGPYGLSLSNDSSNDKKGSELATYHPFYDLSDIIDINDKNELDADTNTTTSAASGSRRIPQQQQPQQSSSVLNTPYHE